MGDQDQSPGTTLAEASVNCFNDDGKLDIAELNFLMGLALKDGVLDDEERKVLADVFKLVEETDVSSRTWDRIRGIKKLYGIE